MYANEQLIGCIIAACIDKKDEYKHRTLALTLFIIAIGLGALIAALNIIIVLNYPYTFSIAMAIIQICYIIGYSIKQCVDAVVYIRANNSVSQGGVSSEMLIE